MIRVLYISTESVLVGTTRAMLEVIGYTSEGNDVFPIVVLGQHGPVEAELSKRHIIYRVFRFYSWVYNAGENTKTVGFAAKRAIKSCLRFWSDLRIIMLIRRYKVDIVHINTSITNTGFMPARICGIPLVWHIREVFEESLNKRFYNKRKSMECMAKADAVLAISEYAASKYRDILKDNLTLIYDGVDYNPFNSHPRNRKALSGENVIATLVGYSEGKGHIEALRALKILRDRGFNNISLRFAGKIYDKRYLEKINIMISELGLCGNVRFLGHCDDMVSVWNETDIALACTNGEGFGRATVEAMAAGCIVIGADSGATPEIVQNGSGFLYPPGDAYALADRIAFALTHINDMQQISEHCRAEVREKFSAERNGRSIRDIYFDIYGKKGIC